MNVQIIDQQTQELSCEAGSFTSEVSDEALEAAGGGGGLGSICAAANPSSLCTAIHMNCE